MRAMRNCIELRVNGLTLRGTHHGVAGVSSAAGQIGVLMLNFGFAPRASLGDITVHQSDYIAKLGHPVFRFDLPGLGDSDGDLPENALTSLQIIQQGKHVPFTCQLVAGLKRRFGLKAILLAGHCGGAITAIYSADLLNGRDIAGILAYEPDFILRGDADWQNSRLVQLRQEVRASVLGSKLGDKAQKLCAHLRRIMSGLNGFRIVKAESNHAAHIADQPEAGGRERNPLPERTNLALINSFQRVMGTGMPILLVAIRNHKLADNFDYVDFLLSNNPPNVTRIVMSETNHSFVEGNGEQALINCTEQWLLENFPVSALSPVQSTLD